MCQHKKFQEDCSGCIYRFKTIKNYSHTRQVEFTAKPRNKLYFGIEIEVEVVSGFDRDDVFEVLHKEIDNCWEMKHDGSLRYGIEFESQPLTLSQVLFTQDPNKTGGCSSELSWMKKISKMISADEETRTGLHVHVNRDALPRRIGRINYFVSKYQDQLTKLSNRVGDGWEHYAAFQRWPEFVAHGSNRYTALNLSRPDTIEFRFFQSTTKQAQVRKYVSLVAAICEYVPKIKKSDLENGRGWEIFCEMIATSGKKLSTWKVLIIFQKGSNSKKPFKEDNFPLCRIVKPAP